MSDSLDAGLYYPNGETLTFEPITQAEESAMFRKALAGDLKMRELLIRRHLLYALKLGRRFSFEKLPVDETTSAANESLMQAIDRFDPARGTRFSSFLIPYVRAAIAKCWRSRSAVNFKHGAPPVEIPIDSTDRGDDEAAPPVPPEMMEPSTIEQTDHDGFLKGELAACSEMLSPRERQVLRLHYIDGFNLAEIGKKLGLSRERIRQIHKSILAALKERLQRRGITRTQ